MAPRKYYFNLYGWQNHSWEFVDQDGRNYDRLSTNAGNIGFNASVDTGMNDIKVNLQCVTVHFRQQLCGLCRCRPLVQPQLEDWTSSSKGW